MKLAYKIAIPISLVMIILILLVTYTSNNAQKKIISDGQKLTKEIVFAQLEANKQEALQTRKLEVNLFLNDAVTIATEYLEPPKDMWLPEEFINSDDPLALMIQNEQQDVSDEELAEFKERINNSLQKLTKYKIIQSVSIKSFVSKKEDVFIGERSTQAYEKLTKKIISKNNKNKILGIVELQYSDQFIKEQFNQARDLIVKDLAFKDQQQQQEIQTILSKQTLFNFIITLVLIFILLLLINKLVLTPLGKLKTGIDSFFVFLKEGSKNITPININSNDELGSMGNNLDDNIQVASKLHTQIHDLNLNLEKKVEQRTEQLNERSTKVRQLLDIASQGFLSFDHSLLIDNEYSKECDLIFNKPIAHLEIVELLYPQQCENKQLFIKTVNDIFNPKLPVKRKKVLLRLLEKEFFIENKYINIEYQHVEDQKMILILTDITDKVALEKKLSKEKQTLKMIVSAVKDLEEFKEMINEYYNFCDQIPSYLEDNNNFKENLLLFYRKIHTFKGNFAQKELLNIVEKLHSFENLLHQLIKDEHTTYQQFANIIEQNNIRTWLDDDLVILEDILDENLLDQESILKIAYSLIENLESKIQTLLEYNKDERDITYEDLLDDVIKMKKRSLQEYLLPYITLTSQIAQKLNKQINPVIITGAKNIYVDNKIKPFIKTLVHIFRNSVDHGIESFDQRTALNKTPQATIECKVRETQTDIILTISDDGKGIDENIIKNKALEKNILSQKDLQTISKEKLLAIIFEDAFSTKESVSQLSGRGIGLGAVKYECEKLGGRIEVSSTLNKGTEFRFILPLKNL